MSTNILVVYYSTFGHVYQLARCVAEGTGRQPDSEVRIRRNVMSCGVRCGGIRARLPSRLRGLTRV